MRQTYSLVMLLSVSIFFVGCQKQTVPAETQSVETDYYKSGFDKYHSKDYSGALEDFDQAIKLKIDLVNSFYWRAVTKNAMGDNKGSCNDYQKASKLGHKQAQAMLNKYCD